MAAPTAITSRIDRSLRALLAEVQDLPRTAEEWDALPDGERAAIALDWDHLLADYLVELDRFCREGEMTDDQQRHYQELLGKLREATPLLRKPRR